MRPACVDNTDLGAPKQMGMLELDLSGEQTRKTTVYLCWAHPLPHSTHSNVTSRRKKHKPELYTDTQSRTSQKLVRTGESEPIQRICQLRWMQRSKVNLCSAHFLTVRRICRPNTHTRTHEHSDKTSSVSARFFSFSMHLRARAVSKLHF